MTTRTDLTSPDLERLRRLLTDHRQVRADQLTALGLQEHVPGGLALPDRLRTAAVARALLADVEAALERLADGSYGWCLRCLRPIGRERLYAAPHVRYCVPCATDG